MAISGTVVKWVTGKGFGFVKEKEGEQEYHVSSENLVGGSRLQEGGEVQFDEETSAPKTKREKEHAEAGKKRGTNVSGAGVIASTQGSLIGTVCEWCPAKNYGFILGTDGSKTYVHVSAFDGARLQPGKAVTYDMEDVAHKSGRQVAVNVAGSAVQARGAVRGIVKSWLQGKGYGFAEDGSGAEVFVHSSAINNGWLMQGKEIFYDLEQRADADAEGGKFSAVNVTGQAVRDHDGGSKGVKGGGFKGGKGGKGAFGRKGGKNAKGGGGGGGGGLAARMHAEGKRKDVDGSWYTRDDFVKQYGGTSEWDAKETRQSPANGKMYTREKFVVCKG